MNNELEATYDPTKPITHYKQLKDLIPHTIDRRADDDVREWLDNYRLIENMLCRDSEVANCAVNPNGQIIYVALNGDLYDIDEIVAIDARLRQLIGRVATFNFAPDTTASE